MNYNEMKSMTDGELERLISNASDLLEQRKEPDYKVVHENRKFQELVNWCSQNMVIDIKIPMKLSFVLAQRTIFSPSGRVLDCGNLRVENAKQDGKTAAGNEAEKFMYDYIERLFDLMAEQHLKRQNEIGRACSKYGFFDKLKEIAEETGIDENKVSELLMDQLY